jgi:uncharacterized protein with PIN domain
MCGEQHVATGGAEVAPFKILPLQAAFVSMLCSTVAASFALCWYCNHELHLMHVQDVPWRAPGDFLALHVPFIRCVGCNTR